MVVRGCLGGKCPERIDRGEIGGGGVGGLSRKSLWGGGGGGGIVRIP